MKIKFAIPLILLSLSCIPDKLVEKPKDLLSESQMVILLRDLHIVEGKIDNSTFLKDTTMLFYKQLETDSVWNKHKISKKQFLESYNYYISDMETMDEIYGLVIDSLGVLESKLQSKSTKK